MAPIGMTDVAGVFSSTEVAIISLVVFVVLSVFAVALCAQCRKSGGNAYDVNGGTTTTDGGTNGTVATKGNEDPGTVSYTVWRTHRDMPSNTLERSTTSLN
ncbi:uncharacterized protein ACB058_013057 [Synchiropus picturatus]